MSDKTHLSQIMSKKKLVKAQIYTKVLLRRLLLKHQIERFVKELQTKADMEIFKDIVFNGVTIHMPYVNVGPRLTMAEYDYRDLCRIGKEGTEKVLQCAFANSKMVNHHSKPQCPSQFLISSIANNPDEYEVDINHSLNYMISCDIDDFTSIFVVYWGDPFSRPINMMPKVVDSEAGKSGFQVDPIWNAAIHVRPDIFNAWVFFEALELDARFS